MSLLADTAVVKFYSAALVLDSLDTRSQVSKGFYVGVPEGVTWTVSSNLLLGNEGQVLLANANGGTVGRAMLSASLA